MPQIEVSHLAGVIYSAGKVFDGLSTGRLDTDSFLISGDTSGIASRADLQLLEDLRDAAEFVLANAHGGVDAEFVCGVNAAISRSGSLHPGQFRTDDQNIGVPTRYGPHRPDAVTAQGMQRIIDAATAGGDVNESAIEMFVALAKAQPFGDGNKRTALLSANGLLIAAGARTLLVVPVDEADTFNDLLARAYIHDDAAGIRNLLRQRGIVERG